MPNRIKISAILILKSLHTVVSIALAAAVFFLFGHKSEICLSIFLPHGRCSPVFELIFPASFYSSILICGFGLCNNKTKPYILRASKSQALLICQFLVTVLSSLFQQYLVSHNKIGDDKDIYNMIMYTKVCETTYLSREQTFVFFIILYTFCKRDSLSYIDRKGTL